MKRTANMPHMFVTLDVSQLSGWLNSKVSCRVVEKQTRKICEVRCGPREGGDGGARIACQKAHL